MGAWQEALEKAHKNNETISKIKPIALVVGGTSGIGEGIARKLTEYTDPEKIIIAGRNKQNGDKIATDLNTISDSNNHEFIPIDDATSMRSVYKYTAEIKSKLSKLNYLVLSVAPVSMHREDSEEGYDRNIAAQFYCRFLFIKELLPLLKKAADAGEEARVISVLAPGYEGEIFEDDLDLEKNYAFRNLQKIPSTYTTCMMQKFAEDNPSISFIHWSPGFVDTALFNKIPWWAKLFFPVVRLFMIQPSDSGEMAAYVLSTREFKSGMHRVSEMGVELPPTEFNNKRNVEIVWKHANHITKSK